MRIPQTWLIQVSGQKGTDLLDQGTLFGCCARQSPPKIKLGICGEHGGEPSSVKYCHTLGLNYMSCSPFRVPTARLAAAQAALA
ncbi:MAG: hypothetical protein HOL43_05030 [Verrucomicrobiales bacterium]|nr:hypothetical protein [Verrucomicrobiales bacterium]